MWIAAKNGKRESGLTAFGQEGSRRCYTPQGGGITSSAQAHHNFPLATGIKPWECNAKRWLITKYCSVILLCILTRKITRITRMIKRTTPVIIKMISQVASCEDESIKKKLLQYNSYQSGLRIQRSLIVHVTSRSIPGRDDHSSPIATMS